MRELATSDDRSAGARAASSCREYNGDSVKALADPRKAKWHDHERLLLVEIEAELDRKREKQLRVVAR